MVRVAVELALRDQDEQESLRNNSDNLPSVVGDGEAMMRRLERFINLFDGLHRAQ